MSEDRENPWSGAKEKPGARSGQKRAERDRSYDVGYGKPPANMQFKKGRSGNPKGRPRKPKKPIPRPVDLPTLTFLEKELYRTVAVRENGKVVELTAIEALERSMVMEGVKGKRLTQKYLLERMERLEREELEASVHRYVELVNLKREGERLIAEAHQKGRPPPTLLPHPDDIVIRPFSDEAYVHGPETPEQAAHYADIAKLRDNLMLSSVHADWMNETPWATVEGTKLCAYMLFAQLVDLWLPRSFRWKDARETLTLAVQYRILKPKVREERIAAAMAFAKEVSLRAL